MTKRKDNFLQRKTNTRKYRDICWVSAEGQTEKDYLQMNVFKSAKMPIKFPKNIHPGRHNPTAVLKRFQKAIPANSFRKNDEAWIVVDVDTWDDTEFSALLSWAKKDSRHHLAISNPKFELFLIMHFEHGNGCTTSQKIDEVLKRYFPHYAKRISSTQFCLKDIQSAIDNAHLKRSSSHKSPIPEPGTTDVYLLIKHLIEDI